MPARDYRVSDAVFLIVKWTAAALALYVALIAALSLLGVTLHLSLLLLPFLLVALPFLIYDLLFRAPREGELNSERRVE